MEKLQHRKADNISSVSVTAAVHRSVNAAVCLHYRHVALSFSPVASKLSFFLKLKNQDASN